MTHHTDELTRLLTGAADDIVERERVPAPDAPVLWRHGRRTTWAARGVAAGLAAALVLVGGALVAVVRQAPPTAPSNGTSVTYPELVSDLFTSGDPVDPGPVFGLVDLPGTYPQGRTVGVIDRSGALTGLPSWSRSADVDLESIGDPGSALAPDGTHLLTPDGIVDLTDGTLTRLLLVEGVSQVAAAGRAVWSPDSQHVALGTLEGPSVLDRFADVVLEPATGDAGVLIAGWRDDDTMLGLRSPSSTDGPAFDIVARSLGDPDWTTVSTISADAVKAANGAAGQMSPSAVFASPDGSRLLLVDPGGHSALVATTTGQRVAFAGAAPASTDVQWGVCAPVWQDNEPLLARGGLRRPGDGATVLAFADRVDAGCVALAGNELTGTAAPGRATTERMWSVFLPVFWLLLLVAAASLTLWSVFALRRSRKHGEDFLPMMLGRLF